MVQIQLKWVLRGLVILLGVLSAGALALGVMLFQQRETLKGRTQKLETALKQVAATLERDETNTEAKVTLPDDQLKTYKALPGGPPPMDGALNLVVLAAQNQLIRLNQTRAELAETKTVLAGTRETLATTSNELVTAKATIVEREATIVAREATISEKEVAIRKLEGEKKDLRAEADTLKQQIDDLETENRDLSDANAVLQAKAEELEKTINPELRKAEIPKGQLGIIDQVNSEWNFVIVRLSPGSVKTVIPDLELLIHRADRLVGKVRVQRVTDSLAVAEILNDWQQLPCAKGDYVLY
ncbi:MAG: hypothetical protein HYV35_12185 [Lentisphaerae bacterium]|nr:hypothetical protein [Lentisphaerota bacterium]